MGSQVGEQIHKSSSFRFNPSLPFHWFYLPFRLPLFYWKLLGLGVIPVDGIIVIMIIRMIMSMTTTSTTRATTTTVALVMRRAVTMTMTIIIKILRTITMTMIRTMAMTITKTRTRTATMTMVIMKGKYVGKWKYSYPTADVNKYGILIGHVSD